VLQRLRVSPLGVFASRVRRRAEDDRWLPNRSAARVLRARLRDGGTRGQGGPRELLFLAEERALARAGRPEAPVVRYAAWLAARLALQQRELLVVIVPQKYTVYAPLLDEGAGAAPAEGAGERYVDRVEARLRERGIAVVNVTGPLEAAARQALPRSAPVYWRDDTHWNAAGVLAAAQAVAPVLDSLGSLGRR
jgi:hypothetical protein